MYDFDKIHDQLLNILAEFDKCSNVILTERQLKYATDTNQKLSNHM